MEWNGGVDYWSGVLDWITGVPRPQMHNFHGYTNLIFERCKAGPWQRIDDLRILHGLASHDVRMRLLSETHLLTCILDLYSWLT